MAAARLFIFVSSFVSCAVGSPLQPETGAPVKEAAVGCKNKCNPAWRAPNGRYCKSAGLSVLACWQAKCVPSGSLFSKCAACAECSTAPSPPPAPPPLPPAAPPPTFDLCKEACEDGITPSFVATNIQFANNDAANKCKLWAEFSCGQYENAGAVVMCQKLKKKNADECAPLVDTVVNACDMGCKFALQKCDSPCTDAATFAPAKSEAVDKCNLRYGSKGMPQLYMGCTIGVGRFEAAFP